MERAVAAALERGHDLALPQTAGLLAFIAVRCGHLGLAHAQLDVLRDLTDRHRAPFSCDTVGHGLLAAIELAIAEGRLDDGRMTAGGPPPLDNSFLFPVAGAMAQLGCLLGDDDDLLDRAGRWIDREPPPRMRVFEAYVGHLAGRSRAAMGRRPRPRPAGMGRERRQRSGPRRDEPSAGDRRTQQRPSRPGACNHIDRWAATVAELHHQPRHRAILDHDRALLANRSRRAVTGLGAWPSDARCRGTEVAFASS